MLAFLLPMRSMNNPSRHWASAVEFDKHTSGLPRQSLCRVLRRCDRTIRDWQTGRRPIPAWTIDTLKVYEFERQRAWQEMFEIGPAVAEASTWFHSHKARNKRNGTT
ncbi:hypothetical protein [Cupriavidus sp. D39]|uniref:hypothetical protein n=1 Tax=Cupriavidus sp. D39 TaxID=2997877 RepID=UPI0022710939|nr:hypothetical protein [Cupriavidus sp. D39]MCY0852704.1 hypothetical protein [Cupriavidus sp. D39]